MVFTKALVLKVLGGLAACTGVAIGGVQLWGGVGSKGQEEENKNNTQNNNQGENHARTQEVEQNQANQNNGQNLQQQPQPQQKPTEGAGNLQPQQPKPQSQVDNAGTAITTSNAELLLRELGLECSEDTTNADNGECTGITEGKTITVKWDEKNKREGITSLTIPSGAKIKYEKDKWDFNYNKKLKVTIFGGDITLNEGTPETITKLEEFETYEVKEEGAGESKKYYLLRKTNSSAGKSKALGLPDNCVLPENGKEVSCTLDVDKLKKINFKDKGSNISVVGGNTATLKIIKTEDSEFADQKYKFTLETDYMITISGSNGTSNYVISPNTNTEFKIKKEGGKLTLEKAWDIDRLAAKVGLLSCVKDTSDSTKNECTFKTGTTINVMNDNDNIKGATISQENSQLKVKYFEKQSKYNQGFKFQALSDIKLTVSTPESGEKKIEGMGSNSSYEIKKIENEWYLSKVTAGK